MKIALVGNQNSGKTTLFNLLTGSNQKIGNWPGVTLERKSGIIKGTDAQLVDLPGIYSLSPYTSEEEVSRQFIFGEAPDLIINIIDATAIERSLYLTTQLMELDTPMVIALNMTDILAKKGVSIDIEGLSKRLDIDIVPISALKRTGIKELISFVQQQSFHTPKNRPIFSSVLEKEIFNVMGQLTCAHARFVAIKLIERDLILSQQMDLSVAQTTEALEKQYQIDIEQIIANARYDYIVQIKKEVITITPMGISVTDRIDHILLNRWLALPIFVVIMFLVYFLSVGVVGGITVELVEGLFEHIGEWTQLTLTNLNASAWSTSLVVDGIIAGVGTVLTFVPQLILLFLCISLLETSGYMSRIAFFLDRIFKRFGLSGKSLIPFIVGSGCSVPGIMATRTIENSEERQMSVMLTPFIPCSAKLPIIALFAGFFFPSAAGFVSASLYLLSIVIIMLSALIMKAFFFKGQPSAFVFELPAYKIPSVSYVLRDVMEKTWEFVKRAGTIIVFASIIVWFLLSFSWQMTYGVNINDSMLASIGNLFSWVFYPMLGELSWGATVSAIQGLVAKEQVVSSMAIIAGFGESISDGNVIFTSSAFAFFTSASAYAFVVFNLFSAPCFAAIGAMRRELKTRKRLLTAVLFQTGLAWILASLTFGLLSLVEVLK